MKKPAVAAALLLLALAGVGFYSYNRGQADPEPAAARTLPVYFTCDTHGRLEPCGCFSGQLGGLTRIRSWLNQYRRDNSLLVDVGNSLAGQDDFRIIKYQHILEAFEMMDYHALNLGAAEAKIPGTSLQEVINSSNAPLISASVVSEEGGELLAPPTRIVTIDNQKVGILGVVAPSSVPAPGEGLRILSLDDAISRHLPDLAGKCDEVILLAYANEEEMQRLAREYFEFSLIIGGDVRQASQYVQKENDSYLVYTSNQARTVGQVSLIREGRRLTSADFNIHLMRPHIPEDAALLALSNRYREVIRKTDLLIDHPERLSQGAVPGVKPLATYVGSDSCLKCHAEAAQKWHASSHAHAFQSLVRRNSDADPTCLACHTVGFGTPSGYRRSFGAEKLTDVGCESCHGPGSEHVKAWNSGKVPSFKFRPLGAGDCLQCHQGEFARPFEWDRFWPLIKHGGKE